MSRRDVEPSAADLAAIEAEWPLIEAELAVVDAEVRLLSAAGGPSPLDWRRLRRAEHRALAAGLRRGGTTDYLGIKDWGDGFGDGHHPWLCGSRCPCRSAAVS